MSTPFDAATKRLLALGPDDWLRLLGLPGRNATLLDSDLSAVTTVSASADGLLRVAEPKPYVCHVELVTSKDAVQQLRNMVRYNGLARDKFQLPVQSVYVLLRWQADNRKRLTGIFTDKLPFEKGPYLTLRYQVLRVWELPVEAFLAGGIATLPLALLARDAEEVGLPAVVDQMGRRLSAEVSKAEADELWAATYVLAGLKYAKPQAAQLLQGVRQMKESSTYRAIERAGSVAGRRAGRVEGRVEGRIEEAQRMLLLAAEPRLGEPSPEMKARVEAIDSPGQLEQIARRIFAVETWDELLTDEIS